ncbi:MAG: endolytic transglycosylase MltG [Candidatus Buchananbacteria bacterium]|nr:endolytic transglycosylase MltG [Candidatus Buchananbacteria bacterium]
MINFFSHNHKKQKKVIPIILGLVIIFIFGWAYYSYDIKTPIAGSQETKEFVVEPGWGSTKISHELKRAGLIRNAYVFQLYVWTHDIDTRLQDGEYFLSPAQNLKEIAQILSRGAGLTKEVTLTFIEGWNNQDIAEYLEELGIASQDDFFEIIQTKADWWDEYELLASRPKNHDLEGYLFPDTYRVFHDATITDIVRKTLDNLDKKITPELRQEISRQGKTIHEILTLASILEKEVSSDKDRKIVADIFYKRLAIGMPLQADSTVNYATGKSVARSSADDLQADSPYNTYKHKGLPPGPIANPSLSSIMAAIYPEKNAYYYFLTTPDGHVVYNETHDGHVADKAKYYR